MHEPVVDVDSTKLGSIALILALTLLAIYVFNLSRFVGAAVILGLLLLLLGGYGWHFRDE